VSPGTPFPARPGPVIFDEIQRIPELFTQLKGWLEPLEEAGLRFAKPAWYCTGQYNSCY